MSQVQGPDSRDRVYLFAGRSMVVQGGNKKEWITHKVHTHSRYRGPEWSSWEQMMVFGRFIQERERSCECVRCSKKSSSCRLVHSVTFSPLAAHAPLIPSSLARYLAISALVITVCARHSWSLLVGWLLGCGQVWGVWGQHRPEQTGKRSLFPHYTEYFTINSDRISTCFCQVKFGAFSCCFVREKKHLEGKEIIRP